MAQEFDGTNTLNPVGFAFSTSAGPFQAQPYPRYVYHATEPPRTVNSKEEYEALGEGWFLTYQHQEYPKIMFAPNGNTVTVNNPEEETAQGSAEGGPWTTTPNPTDPAAPIDQSRSTNFTLQDKAEAIRDSRRLSLDYVQLNQALDCYADNAPMRAIDQREIPRPRIHPTETAEQIRKRREEDEERRNRGEHVEHNAKAKNDKKDK